MTGRRKGAGGEREGVSGNRGRDILEILGTETARLGQVCRVERTVVEIMTGAPIAAGAPPPLEMPSMASNPQARWFPDLESRILLLLCDEPTLTRAEIGQKLNEDPEGHLKHVLRNLKDRYLLESSSNGWTLLVPPDKDTAAYRACLKAWIEAGAGNGLGAEAQGS